MTMPEPVYDVLNQPEQPLPGRTSSSLAKTSRWGWIAGLITYLLCMLHGWATWVGIGGREGLAGDWPILIADHGFHYHHAVVTRNFLLESGMTAGYDPSFMSGYPMSVVTGTSSTLINLVMLVFGKDRPVLVFKVFTLVCVAALPWLVALAASLLRLSARGVTLAVGLWLVYFWTDWPINYADFGMTSYLISVPLGLVATALLCNYFAEGGFGPWFWAAIGCGVVFLVHLTSALVIGPAGILAYLVGIIRSRREGKHFPISRHFGLVAIVPVILAINAFWLLPGYWLASTAGKSDFVFAHPESVWNRLGEIFWREAPVEAISLGLALIGLTALARRRPESAAGLGGLLVAGFSWGYLAGAFRSLDAFQPGRHTYTCYSAACLAGGIGLDEVLSRLRSSRNGRLDRVAMIGLILVGCRIFAPALIQSIRQKDGGVEPFLSSKPSPRMLKIVEQVKKHVKPGERLLFEETGFPVEGQNDPYDGRHLSPILPHLTGVELLGGPYLHTPVQTNFTQFGENRLFDRKDWDREYFNKMATLYRPSAICCWSKKARAFCQANPDLIQILDDDGTVLFGRVLGFEGATIRGSARVDAGPNSLVVRDATAGTDSGGLIVLRYHWVPFLQAEPAVGIEPVKFEEDPVPFIGIRPSPSPVTIRMVLPLEVWRKRSAR